VHEHRTILGALDLESRLPSGLSAAELVELMGRDKKADHDLTFILDGPHGIEVVRNLDAQVVRSSLERMGAQP
jgi:5-deoxy-5-amino-3-dehydroquinate synthase